MNKKIVFSVISAVLVLIVLAFIGNVRKSAAKPENSAREKNVAVLCTTYPIYLFAREVAAGTPVDVKLIIPAGTGCPHEYTLTPGDMRKAGQGDALLLKNGLGLDDGLADALARTNPKLVVTDTSKAIDGHKLLKYDGCRHHHHHSRMEEEDEHGEEHHEDAGDDGEHHESSCFNPHLFASPFTARAVVKAIASAMIARFPEYAGTLESNEKTFLASLDGLCSEFKEASKSFKHKKIGAQHDVMDYLAEELDLETAVLLKADEGDGISPAEIRRIAGKIKEHDVSVIFVEPQYRSQMAKLAAEESGIAVIAGFDPVATGPENPEKGYYEAVMRKNLAVMEKLLGNE